MFGHSESGISMNDMTNSPDDGVSNGPTPNSGTSEQRHMLSTTSNGRLSASGGNSFSASPASSHQNLGGSGQTPENAASQQQRGQVNAAAAYFADPAAYSIAANEQFHGVPISGSDQFAVPQGWGMAQEMQAGGTAMTPVSEGVLRSIMQMGPLETMDLQWSEGQ
jgi:hypothetical protein